MSTGVKPKIFIRDTLESKGETIDVEVPADKYLPSYPFDPNSPPTKPVLTVHNLDVNDAYATLVMHITNQSQIPEDLLIGYLWAAAQFVEIKISSNWTSYGILIANAGKVNPTHLLERSASTLAAPDLQKPSKRISPEEHKTLVTYLLSVYRLATISRERVGSYYDELENKIENIINTGPFRPPPNLKLSMAKLLPAYASWVLNKSFQKLVAAYDTILTKDGEEWSIMRIATVTSAYEGCNALLSVGYFAKKLSLPVEDALGYILDRQAVGDLKKMLHPNQEVEIQDSYFTHFRAFGFSPKSPYSATAAPYFYNLVHMVGAFMGDTRSLNAVAMEDAGIHPLATLGAYIGYYFMGSGDYGLFIGKDAQADERKRALTKGLPAQTKSPAFLLELIKSKGSRMPDEFYQRFKKIAEEHKQVRDGTIAQWLKIAL